MLLFLILGQIPLRQPARILLTLSQFLLYLTTPYLTFQAVPKLNLEVSKLSQLTYPSQTLIVQMLFIPILWMLKTLLFVLFWGLRI